MLSPADDIATKLDVEGIGAVASSSAWALFVGHLPEPSADVSDTAILVQNAPGNLANPKIPIDDDGLIVIVRGAVGGESAAYAKMYEVRASLLGMDKEVIAGSTYIGAWEASGVEDLGKTENQQIMLGYGLRIMREPVDVGNRT